jgi:hypothetical protein
MRPPNSWDTTIRHVRLAKILCFVALLSVIGSLATNGFFATGTETINKPIVLLGLSKIELNKIEPWGSGKPSY